MVGASKIFAAVVAALCAWAVCCAQGQPDALTVAAAPQGQVGPPLTLPIEHQTSRSASTAPTSTPGTIDRPSFAGRQVSVFDFEEQSFNPEDVPANWFRAQDAPTRQRKGFPWWNQAVFDFNTAHSGTASVRLPTRGGSTALRLSSGLIQVFPDAEYRVSGFVRTDGLRHAVAAIEASVLGDDGEPLPGAVVRSAPVQAPDGWLPVALTLHGPFPGARSLRIELLLLQPDQFPLSRVAEQYVPRAEDRAGAAYFDDVVVIQLPRVRLTSNAPANVFANGARPELLAQVRDLTGEELHAEIVTSDLLGNVVDRQEIALGRGGTNEKIVPRLPRYGWYSATMNLTRVSTLSAEAGRLAHTTLLWVGSGATPGDDRSGGVVSPFTLVAESISDRQLMPAAQLAAICRASRLTLPGSLTDSNSPTARSPLEQVLLSGAQGPAELSIALTHLPLSLADRVRLEPRDVLALGGVNPAEWLGLLSDRFAEIGPRVGNWQIGSVTNARSGDDGRALPTLSGLRSGIHKFSPNPRLVLPWRADTQWPSGNGKARPFHAVNLVYPSSFPISEVSRTLSAFAPMRDEGLDVTIVPETLPPELFGVRAELHDWAQRAVMLWASSQPTGTGQARPRIALVDPWDSSPADASQLLPRPTIAALATLNRAISGRRLAGEVPAGQGVRGLILAPEEGGPAIGSLSIGSGALIVWTEAGDDAADSIAGYFGGGTLTLIDLFGNQAPLRADPSTGRHIIPVTGAPVIVEGIDAHLVRFIAEIRITPSFIPAVVATHDCEILVKNPWNTRITGDVQLLPPETGARSQREWSFAPNTPMPFSIAPGQTARLPFSFIFSTVEEAGPKPVQLLVRLSADRPYPAMRISKSINVGLEDLELNVSATLGPREDGPNVIITATVTNSGRLTRTLQLTSHAVGFVTQSQPVVDLSPGETAVRRFILPNGAEALAGRKVRILMVDVDGAERLNKYAVVPN